MFYSNFVPKTHRFKDILRRRDLENRVRGPPKSLKMSSFDKAHIPIDVHSNHGPISYRFRDRWRFPSKIAKISNPRVFCAPADRVLLGVGYRCWWSKTRMMGLSDRERTLNFSLWIQCTNVTDGRTDRHRPTAKCKDRAYA